MFNLPFIEAHFVSMFFKFMFASVFLLCYLWVLHRILSDEHLRKLFIQSLCDENGRISGKSISACVLVNIIIMGWFIAIYYDEHHLAPEYYFWGIVSLIAGLYGIKEFGKYTSTKFLGITRQGAVPSPEEGADNNQENNQAIEQSKETIEQPNPEKGKSD